MKNKVSLFLAQVILSKEKGEKRGFRDYRAIVKSACIRNSNI